DPRQQTEQQEQVAKRVETAGRETAEEVKAEDSPQRDAERDPLDDDRRNLLAKIGRRGGDEQVGPAGEDREQHQLPERVSSAERERERADRRRDDDRRDERDAGEEQHLALQPRVAKPRDGDAHDRAGRMVAEADASAAGRLLIRLLRLLRRLSVSRLL